jgi:hypothetical protein
MLLLLVDETKDDKIGRIYTTHDREEKGIDEGIQMDGKEV